MKSLAALALLAFVGSSPSTIEVGVTPMSLAYGAGSVWSANKDDGTVSRIDVASNRVTATIRVGGEPWGLAFGAGSLWVGNYATGTVARIDPARNAVVARIAVGREPIAIAYGLGSVWAATYSAPVVARIDPARNRVASRWRVAGAHLDVLPTSRGVWVVSEGGDVLRLDARTGRVQRRLHGGADPSFVQSCAGAVWVSNFRGSVLRRINAATGRLAREVKVGSGAAGLACTDMTLWIARYDRGVVLRLAGSSKPKVAFRAAGATDVLAVAGSVWAAASEVVRLRLAAAPAPSQSVKVGSQPVTVTAGAGYVWVSNYGDGTVSRINPATNRVVKIIPLNESPYGIAYGAGAIWVSSFSDPTVLRIDPATNTVVATIPLPESEWPENVAFGEGSAWVAVASPDTLDHPELDSVLRIDPATNAVTTRIGVGHSPEGIAFTPDALWVADHRSETAAAGPTGVFSVSRVDTKAGREVDRIHVETRKTDDPHGRFCCGPQGIAAAAGAVWVADPTDSPGRGFVVRLDPQTDAVVATVPLTQADACGDVTGDDSAVWVAAGCDQPYLTRIDPHTNRVVARVDVGGGAGSIWIASGKTLLRLNPS
jgi:YVTN family beta-propeller protein